MLWIVLGLVLVGAVAVWLFMQQPIFGKAPSEEVQKRLALSPNYKDGAFQNKVYTPDLTEGYSMLPVMIDFFFNKSKRNIPTDIIPSVQTDLKKAAELNEDWLVWFGHSSYLMHLNQLNILVDPVFSGNASPIPGSTTSFRGTDMYDVEDMPEIDYLMISHDHYDHLDYKTVKALQPKVKKVICGLGVGSHFMYWGYSEDQIIELDWDQSADLNNDIKVHALTTRHFSGRSLKRNNTLWVSYLLELPDQKIFVGGDSGYADHFKNFGERFGSIDLAILENGQYNEAWHAIHFLPGENVQAAVDMHAKKIMPVHSAKFSLSLHDWDEPLKEITSRADSIGLPYITPKIGELVYLNNNEQEFEKWWEGIN